LFVSSSGRAAKPMARIACLSWLAGAALGQTFDGKTKINDPEYLNFLNSENSVESTWVAGANAVFEGMTFDDARSLLGTELSHISEHLDKVLDDSVYSAIGDPPASFDARTNWPGLIHPIRNQQKCGSCWAFSASEVLSDRVAIASNRTSPVLSPEDMVSCDTWNHGCGGGNLWLAWKYLKSEGIVSDACFPYTAGGGTAPACKKTCVNSETWETSKVKAQKSFAIWGAKNMQKELMTGGPIQVAFQVYKSFMAYRGGVYQKPKGEFLPEGGHAVKIVGWGSENNVDYWLVANSWTTSWGLKGFFKMKRGWGGCGMEIMGPPYAGVPATTSLLIV